MEQSVVLFLLRIDTRPHMASSTWPGPSPGSSPGLQSGFVSTASGARPSPVDLSLSPKTLDFPPFLKSCSINNFFLIWIELSCFEKFMLSPTLAFQAIFDKLKNFDFCNFQLWIYFKYHKSIPSSHGDMSYKLVFFQNCITSIFIKCNTFNKKLDSRVLLQMKCVFRILSKQIYFF